jgi:hypothetical protein
MYEIARTCFVLEADRHASPERQMIKTKNVDSAEIPAKKMRQAPSDPANTVNVIKSCKKFGVRKQNGEIVYLTGFEFDTAALEAAVMIRE